MDSRESSCQVYYDSHVFSSLCCSFSQQTNLTHKADKVWVSELTAAQQSCLISVDWQGWMHTLVLHLRHRCTVWGHLREGLRDSKQNKTWHVVNVSNYKPKSCGCLRRQMCVRTCRPFLRLWCIHMDLNNGVQLQACWIHWPLVHNDTTEIAKHGHTPGNGWLWNL